MSFSKKKFLVVKKVISEELSDFIYKYFLLKRQVANTMFDYTYISPFSDDYGTYTDHQAPNTYSHYADVVMETLAIKIFPIMEMNTKTKLLPTYTYARIYKNGDILKRHKDRSSCEISTTLHLGGDKEWPILLCPNKNSGHFNEDGSYTSDFSKGIKIILEPGDMLIYKGCDLEHWRESFTGETHAQVFLHYVEKSKENEKLIFDTRPHLGLPSWFKGKGEKK